MKIKTSMKVCYNFKIWGIEQPLSIASAHFYSVRRCKSGGMLSGVKPTTNNNKLFNNQEVFYYGHE